MKIFHFATGRAALAVMLVMIGLLVTAPIASANFRVPAAVPAYARLGSADLHHTDEWAVIVFYHPPECTPADFNLLDFYDVPRVFDCQDQTVSGFEIWPVPPGGDALPTVVELHGSGAVPVWFVSWPALQAAIADNMLTIGELKSLTPLVGSATAYQETVRPSLTLNVGGIEFNARGTLDDGRSFRVHAQAVAAGTSPGLCFAGSIHCRTEIVFK